METISDKVVDILESVASSKWVAEDDLVYGDLMWCIEMILSNKIYDVNINETQAN